jgi:hypothetical protein
MVQITITVQGLQETVNSLNKTSTALKTELKRSLDIIGDKSVKEFQNEAHVKTGKMKKGIRKGKVTPNALEIISQEKYAVFENRRRGAHAFIDKGAKKTETIARQEMANLIRNVTGKR